MKHEARERLGGNGHFVIYSEYFLLTQLAEVEIEPRELKRVTYVELQLFSQLPGKRFLRIFAGIHGTTKTPPVIRIENIWHRITQLHHIVSPLKDEESRHGVCGPQVPGCCENDVFPHLRSTDNYARST